MTSPNQIVVGSVAVEVTASARGFARSLRREVDESFRGIGAQMRRHLSDQLARDPIRVPVEPDIDRDAVARSTAGAGRPIRLPVETDDTSAAVAGRQASAIATRAAGPIRLRVDIDRAALGRALSMLGGVARVATLAAGGLAAIGAIGSGVSAALAGIAAAGAGLIPILGQIIGVAVAAAGALAALPGAFAIAGASIGTLIIGSSGLGAAFKEVGQAAGGGGGAVTDFARQVERAARQVELAERAIPRALRGIADAERRLALAQRDAVEAQEAVNRARRDAVENLEDLELSLAAARLDEEAAVLAVADAERDLINARRTRDDREIVRADLAYRQSLQTLDEVRDRLGDVGEEHAEAAEAGVEGSEQVQDALRAQEESTFRLADAEQDLADAHTALADAQYDLAQAQRDLADAQNASAASGGGAASAMSKLAPAAQELVRTLLRLKVAWDALALDVQQALWVGIAAEIEALAERQLPVLRDGFVGIAEVLNGAMRDGLRTLATDASAVRLAEIFESARTALAGLASAIQPVIRALLDVSSVGADVIADLSGGLGDVISRLAGDLSQAAESGRLREIILDGVDAVLLLGSALGDVVGILRGVFAAAGSAGGGIFGFLDNLNRLVNSIAGQEALTRFFAELGRIGDALMPVLLALGRGLGVVADAIGDIAVQTAPFLADFLGLLAEALASLAPGFIALGPSVVALGRALLPLGTILADLVVGLAPGVTAFLEGLGAGLGGLAPAALVVGRALGALLEAAAPLVEILGTALAAALTVVASILEAASRGPVPALIRAFAELYTTWASQIIPVVIRLGQRLLPILAQVGERVVAAFTPLIPVIARVAEQVAGQLLTALPRLVEAFSALVEPMAMIADDLAVALVEILAELIPQLPMLVDLGIQLAFALLDVVRAFLPLLPSAVEFLGLVLRFVTPSVLAALILLVRGAATGLRIMAGAVRGILGPIQSAIGFVTRLRDAVRDRINSAVQFFRDLPGRILRALGNMGNLLWRAGWDVISGLTRGIRDALPNVTQVARNIGSSVLNAAKSALGISSPSRVFRDEVGREIPAGIAVGIAAGAGVAERAVADLDLVGQFANRSDPLRGFGGDLAFAATAAPQPGAVLDWAPGASGDPLLDALKAIIRVRRFGDPTFAFAS